MFVNVALNIPAHKLFTYEIPESMKRDAQVGKRVFVPVGQKMRTGFIVEIIESCGLSEVRPIAEVLDNEPLFNEKDILFYNWIADYFIHPLGKALAEIIPSGPEKKDYQWIAPLPANNFSELSKEQEKLMELLRKYPKGIALDQLRRLTQIKNILPSISSLQQLGALQVQEKQSSQLSPQTEKIVMLNNDRVEAKLTLKQRKLVTFLQDRGEVTFNDLVRQSGISAAVIKKLCEKGILDIREDEKIRNAGIKSVLWQKQAAIRLNAQQEDVLQEISSRLDEKCFFPVLLHGVTGSGKTEVYLKAIEKVIADGGETMYLVPEISLTPQLIARIEGRINPERIAVLHSGIANRVRYDQWRQIRRGQIKLVVGARSAIFAPLPDLRLIVVDEEHDTSYKQDDRLCYSARDLAVMKAKLNGAVVVLGSATPSVQTYFNADSKKYYYLELAGRVENKALPSIEIIDMKAAQKTQSRMPIFSPELAASMETTLARKEQILLFLNRRGFDTFLVCADCGYTFRCPNCSVSLKNHPAEGIIKCHYCDYRQKAQPLCPSCRGSRVLNYGVGTQKLEAEIRKIFPDARVQRMDADTTSTRGSQEKILYRLWQREIDILVGTQMITKGHDFPHITLVGVISADTGLNMPDFRASERTFQQLMQVAGRGGRGDVSGRVVIQTFNPQHYVFKYVQNHDYKSFYAEEIALRRELNYPPFSRIISLRLSSTKNDHLREFAENFARLAKNINKQHGNKVEIIGPAPSPLAKIKSRFRFQTLLKSDKIKTLRQLAKELLSAAEKSAVKIAVDVDPENFM